MLESQRDLDLLCRAQNWRATLWSLWAQDRQCWEQRGNGVAKDRDAQLWAMLLLCKFKGTFSFTGHPHWLGMYVGIMFSIWGQQYHTLPRFPWFLQSRGYALLLEEAVKMLHLLLPTGWCFSKAKSSRAQVFWGWCLSTGALGLESAGILDSRFSSFLSEPASKGLINALRGHTPDGRGKWETGSQTGQHFRHLSQLGSVGRAFCLPLSPASLACPAASCQENLRQQSSGVRAVPSLQCIDRNSLKESGLDIWDTYWLLHWLSSCPDPHSLSIAWITCTSALGQSPQTLKGYMHRCSPSCSPCREERRCLVTLICTPQGEGLSLSCSIKLSISRVRQKLEVMVSCFCHLWIPVSSAWRRGSRLVSRRQEVVCTSCMLTITRKMKRKKEIMNPLISY